VKATCLEALLPYTRRHNPKGIAENRVVEKSLHVINTQNDGVAGGRQNRETPSGSHCKRKKVHVLLTTQILSPRIAHAGHARPWAVRNAAAARIRKKSGIGKRKLSVEAAKNEDVKMLSNISPWCHHRNHHRQRPTCH